MKILLLLFTVLLSINGYAQSTSDCEKVLSEKIDTNVDLKELNQKLSELKNCGLNQNDVDFFSQGPMLATMMISILNTAKEDITYQQVFDKIMEFKQVPEYEKTIQLYKISNELLQKKVTIKNWESDKLLLNELELSSDTVENIRLMVLTNLDPNKTYADLLKEEQKKKASLEKMKINELKDSKDIFTNLGNVNYDDLLKKSIELKKPLLLYFTGYACVNCRKIEHNLLSDSKIYEQLINDFHFVSLYVDDKKKLPEDEQTISILHDKPIKYIGQKHSELQISKFKINTQPYFVIIDNEGNKVNSIGYVRDAELFINFLKSVN